MKKDYGRILSRSVKRGLKIVSLSALGSLVAICSPQAVCHVSASGPVRFTTYLMIEENGEFATDNQGRYIQLVDEKGNLLAYNEDVKEFLEANRSSSGDTKLGAKAKAFYLINGRLYSDESGQNELSDLSQVMPAMFKYGSIDSGYTLEADGGTVYLSPLNVSGESVYVARVAGEYEKLPAFTISQDGKIGYLDRGAASDGDNEVSFVYDSNYFYDENMNQLQSIEALVPSGRDENAPMFTGYYIKNGGDRRQFLDIDGSITISAEDYKAMAGSDTKAQAEYCYRITLNAESADSLTVYSDIDNGSLYSDYQKTEGFDNVGGDILSQLSYDSNTGRGHFAGYYESGDEGSFTRRIGSDGNIVDAPSTLDGNRQYNARFYHIITADGSSVYFSDGKAYSDAELMSGISNIADVTGSIPEDHEEKVHSDEKDMDGVAKKYFIGYYFSSDFGSDGEADSDKEMLLSEYKEDGFDPSDVEINKVKFADRDGNIVFNSDDAPDIDEDMSVYQNWYTVTVWDDGEVEVEDKADEVKKDKSEITDEEASKEEVEDPEGKDKEKAEGDTEEKKEGEESGDKKDEAGDQSKDTGDKKDEAGDQSQVDGAGKDQQNADAPAQGQTPENTDNKEGIEENAKPNDEDKMVPAAAESGDDDDDGQDGESTDSGESQSSDNSGESNNTSGDMDADLPKSEEDKEQ